jgi:hypothetical protein
MLNPERFQRILNATSEINAEGFSRERHAELVFAVCEQADCRESWQRVLNEKSRRGGFDPSVSTASSDNGGS